MYNDLEWARQMATDARMAAGRAHAVAKATKRAHPRALEALAEAEVQLEIAIRRLTWEVDDAS